MKHALLTYSKTGLHALISVEHTDKQLTKHIQSVNGPSIHNTKTQIETIKQWQLYNYKHIQEQHSEIISSPL